MGTAPTGARRIEKQTAPTMLHPPETDMTNGKTTINEDVLSQYLVLNTGDFPLAC